MRFHIKLADQAATTNASGKALSQYQIPAASGWIQNLARGINAQPVAP
jgi:hypothetical protein